MLPDNHYQKDEFIQGQLKELNEQLPAFSHTMHRLNDRACWVSADLLCWLKGTASQEWCNTSRSEFNEEANKALHLGQKLRNKFTAIYIMVQSMSKISMLPDFKPSSNSAITVGQPCEKLYESFEQVMRDCSSLTYDSQLLMSELGGLKYKINRVDMNNTAAMKSLRQQCDDCWLRLQELRCNIARLIDTTTKAGELQDANPQSAGICKDRVINSECPVEISETFAPGTKLGAGILAIRYSNNGLKVRVNRICKAGQVERTLRSMKYTGSLECWVHGSDVPEQGLMYAV